MCEQCLTNPVYFGEPIPGFILARARRQGNDWNIGDWGLIECNDPSFTWSMTPTPNPCWGMTDDEEDEWENAADKNSIEYKRWFGWPREFVEQFENCGPNTGYDLVAAAMQVGYDRKKDGTFAYWLFDYLAEYLKTAIADPDDEPCFPERDKIFPIDLTIGRDPLPNEPILKGILS